MFVGVDEEKFKQLEEAVERIKEGEIVEFKLKSKDKNLCLGDLTKIGWAQRLSWGDGMQWQYVGPNSIKVEDDVLVSGSYTKELTFSR